MFELLIVGIAAGFLAAISPCILPVLPVVLVAGAAQPTGRARRPPRRGQRPAPGPPSRWASGLPSPAGTPSGPAAAATGRARRASGRRTGPERTGTARWPAPPAVGRRGPGDELQPADPGRVGDSLALHLPQDSLRDAGIALLVVVGLGFLFPPFGALLERPFARMTHRASPTANAGGFVLGLAPRPAVRSLRRPDPGRHHRGRGHRIGWGWTAVFLTVAFAVGAAVPLLVVAVAGGQLTQPGRAPAPPRRPGAPGQRGDRADHGPGHRAQHLLGAAARRARLHQRPAEQDRRRGEGPQAAQRAPRRHASQTSLANCNANATSLVNCGPAPNFKGITAWLNTPGGSR